MDTLDDNIKNSFNELEQFHKQKKEEKMALLKLLERLDKEHQKSITNLKTKKK